MRWSVSAVPRASPSPTSVQALVPEQGGCTLDSLPATSVQALVPEQGDCTLDPLAGCPSLSPSRLSPGDVHTLHVASQSLAIHTT
jgi:hypothetical protein